MSGTSAEGRNQKLYKRVSLVYRCPPAPAPRLAMVSLIVTGLKSSSRHPAGAIIPRAPIPRTSDGLGSAGISVGS
jgi:hypothetical protein